MPERPTRRRGADFTRRRVLGFTLGGALVGMLGPEPLPEQLDPTAGGAARDSFRDPLDQAAPATTRGSRNALYAVTNSGGRWVACGARGLILVSDDSGRNWQQAAVPVSSDLVALHFPTPLQGWAVGHDGVVLHSADAGNSWQLQLDGRRIEQLLRGHFSALAGRGDNAGTRGLAQLERDFAHGPELPLLSVWFETVRRGFASGAFGLLLGTDDGGSTWQPWTDLIDNPDDLHLNAVRRIGAGWYIASERGTVFHLAPGSRSFAALSTGYAGSFFGLMGNGAQLLAYGLRGNARCSADAGQHWAASPTGLGASAGASLVLPDGRWMLASVHGQLSLSGDRGASFAALPLQQPMALCGLADAADELIAVGPTGIRRLPCPAS